MTDREVITGYRDTVFLLHTIRQYIAWHIRHGMQRPDLTAQTEQLKHDLIRFDDIVDSIPDRRVRTAICCRYALGLTIVQTAEYMNISKLSVNRLLRKAWASIESPAADPT